MAPPQDSSTPDNSARPPSATFRPLPSVYDTVGFMNHGATGWDRCSGEDKEDWDLMRMARRKYKLPSPRPASLLENGRNLQQADEITFRATGHNAKGSRQLPAGSPKLQFALNSEDISARTRPERAIAFTGQETQEETSQHSQPQETQCADYKSHLGLDSASLAGADPSSSGAAMHSAITERTGGAVRSSSDVSSLPTVTARPNFPSPTKDTRMYHNIEEEAFYDNSPTKLGAFDDRMHGVQTSIIASTTSQNHSLNQIAPSDGDPCRVAPALRPDTPRSASTMLAGNPIQPSRFSAYLPGSPPPKYSPQTQSIRREPLGEIRRLGNAELGEFTRGG